MITDDERLQDLQRLLELIKPLRVLLVESDPRLRGAIRNTIALEPAFELAAECVGKGEALQVIQRMPLDIVLVSLKLTDGSGLDVIRAAKQFQPRAEVLAMGTADNKEDIPLSLEAGAAACLMKENGIRPGKVDRNSIVGSVAFSRMLVNPPAANEASFSKETQISELSSVQLDILRYLVGGLSDKEIARRLLLSSYDLDYHLKRLHKRFRARNRVQLIRAAMSLFQN